MEQNDMLSSLLSDPEKLQSAIAMATSILGSPGAGAGPPPSAPGGSAPAPQAAASAPPPTFPTMAPAPPPGHNDYDPSAELMQRAMPVLKAVLRGSQSAVNPDKIHLLNAIKPFVAADVSGQLDRAMRLVSMARVARTAMRQIGGGKAALNGDDGVREV